MKIKVKLFGQFRYITNSKEVEVETKGDTVKDAVDSIRGSFPALGQAMMNGEELRPYVNLLVNGRNFKETGGFSTKLVSGDEIVLFPPMAGG